MNELTILDTEQSRLLSYFMRWGVGEIAPYFKHERVIIFETDKFMGFLPQLNDRRVKTGSIVRVHNSTTSAQITSKLPLMVKKKLIHVIPWEQEDVKADGIVAVSEHILTPEDLRRWHASLSNRQKHNVVVIFPSVHHESMQRLGYELKFSSHGPVRMDFMYHQNKKAHDFIRNRFGSALTLAHFQFLSRWSYVALSLRQLDIPEKMTETLISENKSEVLPPSVPLDYHKPLHQYFHPAAPLE